MWFEAKMNGQRLNGWSVQTAGPLALNARTGDVTQAFGFVAGKARNEAFDLGLVNGWTFWSDGPAAHILAM